MYILGDNIIFPSITTFLPTWRENGYDTSLAGSGMVAMKPKYQRLLDQKSYYTEIGPGFFSTKTIKNVRNPETSFFFVTFVRCSFFKNEITGPFVAKNPGVLRLMQTSGDWYGGNQIRTWALGEFCCWWSHGNLRYPPSMPSPPRNKPPILALSRETNGQ